MRDEKWKIDPLEDPKCENTQKIKYTGPSRSFAAWCPSKERPVDFFEFWQMSTPPIYNHHFWHQKHTFVDGFTKNDAVSRFLGSRARAGLGWLGWVGLAGWLGWAGQFAVAVLVWPLVADTWRRNQLDHFNTIQNKLKQVEIIWNHLQPFNTIYHHPIASTYRYR